MDDQTAVVDKPVLQMVERNKPYEVINGLRALANGIEQGLNGVIISGVVLLEQMNDDGTRRMVHMVLGQADLSEAIVMCERGKLKLMNLGYTQ